jgi:hypothetical protein
VNKFVLVLACTVDIGIPGGIAAEAISYDSYGIISRLRKCTVVSNLFFVIMAHELLAEIAYQHNLSVIFNSVVHRI